MCFWVETEGLIRSESFIEAYELLEVAKEKRDHYNHGILQLPIPLQNINACVCT